MKKCPYCAEEIQDEAIVCKHCGRDLVANPPPTPTGEVVPKTVNVELRDGYFLVSAQPSAQRVIVWRFEGNAIVTGPHGVRLRRPSLDGIFYDLHSSWEIGEGLKPSLTPPPGRSRSIAETPDSDDEATITVTQRVTGTDAPSSSRSKIGCGTWFVILFFGVAFLAVALINLFG